MLIPWFVYFHGGGNRLLIVQLGTSEFPKRTSTLHSTYGLLKQATLDFGIPLVLETPSGPWLTKIR